VGQRQDGTEPMSPAVAVMVLESPNATERMVVEAVATLAGLVEQKTGGHWHDVTGEDGNPLCWHFVGYRPGAAKLGKHGPTTLNDGDMPQYQGVIFADGTVAMRWLTLRRSTSTWDTFADMFDVHGHPEYGTEIHWPNGAPQEARDVIEAAAQAYRERVAAEEAERADAIAEANNRGDFLLPEGSITIGDPTQENTPPPELPGAVASSPDGWVVSSLAELTPEQTAEILDAPRVRALHGPHFEDTAGPTRIPAGSSDGNTLVVCLDDQGVPEEDGGHRPLIVPFTEKVDADGWLRVHQENNPRHRVVTVPGWPPPSVAIGIASAHARDNGGTS
jgi:hypothetical protein